MITLQSNNKITPIENVDFRYNPVHSKQRSSRKLYFRVLI